MIILSLEKNLCSTLSQIINLAGNKDKAWSSKTIKSNEIPFNIHLAVLVEPYLRYIFEGKKKVESRFSINKIAPYKKTEEGDVILLKISSGSILGMCTVQKSWFYELNSENFSYIRTNFSEALCVPPTFWVEKEKSKYATLIQIDNVIKFDEAIKVEKKDRRGWIVLYKRNEPLKKNAVLKEKSNTLNRWL